MRPAGYPPALQQPAARSNRRRRIALAALVLSILLHLVLLGNWHLPIPHLPFPALPLRVQLAKPFVSHPAANHSAHARLVQPTNRQRTTSRLRHHPALRMLRTLRTLHTTNPSTFRPPVYSKHTPTPVVPASVAPSAPAATPSEKSDKLPAPSAPPASDISGLPKKLLLQYRIYLGEGGIDIGHASYAWIQDDNRYTLASIAQADGLLSLFQSGQITQISTGHIDNKHLLPDDFEIQRGNGAPDTTTRIHINHDTQLATVTRHGHTSTETAPDGAQDILSIIFELALRAPFANTITLPVSSGKAFKPYHAAIVGTETLDTPLGKLQTLHITRPPEDGDDGMDIWLAVDDRYLPVKIRLHDGQLGWIVQVITHMQTSTPKQQ